MANLAKQIEYWYVSAGRDWRAAEALFVSRRYDASLFFCHLVLEKILKGLVVVKTKMPAPYSHNLAALAYLAGIELSEDQIKNLRMISTLPPVTMMRSKRFIGSARKTMPNDI